jgi:hypothetical protein
MRIAKGIFVSLVIILLLVANYLYHFVVFNFKDFEKQFPFIAKFLNIQNDYFSFFFNHDVTPLYTFKNDLLTKYQKYSFLNKKS